MPFQFSFSLPTLPNPFASSSSSESFTILEKDESDQRGRSPVRQNSMNFPRLSSSPCPSTSTSKSISAKRGWEPSYASKPSCASIATVTTDGYLDTPAKYRDVAGLGTGREEEQEMLEEMMEDLRPAKRRKTFTDSIVSTAYSAALISTAVGYTVYKYWRDRGRERPPAEEAFTNFRSPPPPYEPEWSPITRTEVSPPPPSTPTIRIYRDMRPIEANSRTRRRYQRRHQRRPGLKPSSQSLRSLPPSSRLHVSLPNSDGDDGEGDEVNEVGSQIDSMSARLVKLIQDGQRALNAEVVITSESREDELDDGTGQWFEDDDSDGRSSPSKSVYEYSDLRSHPVPNTFLSPPRPDFPNVNPPGSFPTY